VATVRLVAMRAPAVPAVPVGPAVRRVRLAAASAMLLVRRAMVVRVPRAVMPVTPVPAGWARRVPTAPVCRAQAPLAVRAAGAVTVVMVAR